MPSGEANRIKVLLIGSPRLRDNLLSDRYGGTKLSSGIVDSVGSRFAEYSLDLMFESCESSESLRRLLEEMSDRSNSAIRRFGPDIVVLSVDADLEGATGEWGKGPAERVELAMLEVIRLIKRDLGSHAIVLNASTVVPGERVSNYQKVDTQPKSLDAHRLNLAAMRLSFAEGISIVDVDRLIAELGGADHVLAFLDYSPEACSAIRDEFVRIIEDYGFLDARPLLPQVGQGASNQ